MADGTPAGDDLSIISSFGIEITPVIGAAISDARQQYEPYLFNHVVRSWLFAVRVAQIKGIAYDAEVLAIGTILHDITLNERFSGPRRFEVEAADQVKNYAAGKGMDSRQCQLVWDSVALNATPSIGLFKEPEVALCTTGIGLDVVGYQYDLIPAEEMTAILKAFPRLALKRRMTRCFCHMAETVPSAGYGTFVQDFGARYVTGYAAPSVADMVLNAPFDE